MKITKKAIKAVMNAYGEKVIDIWIDPDNKLSAFATTYSNGTVSEWFFDIPLETCRQQHLSSVVIHEGHKRPDVFEKLVTTLNK